MQKIGGNWEKSGKNLGKIGKYQKSIKEKIFIHVVTIKIRTNSQNNQKNGHFSLLGTLGGHITVAAHPKRSRVNNMS